jgi:hypothetical protein
MSLKRSLSSGRSSFGGGGEAGAKVDRQELYDELKRLAGTGEAFTPVDVSLAIGAGEPQVSKALLGLAAEGYLEKAEVGKYRATTVADLSQAEFLKAFARASKVDSTRQRDLSEIGRLKQNNDTMRQRLLAAIAERDHYLGVLKKHGIDPGPAPVPVAPSAAAPTAPLEASAPPPAASAPVEASAPPPAASAPVVEAAAPPPVESAAPPPALRLPSSAASAAPGPHALSVPSPEPAEAPSGPGDDHGHEEAHQEGHQEDGAGHDAGVGPEHHG